MSESTLRQITQLSKLSFPELQERWRSLFGGEPPAYHRRFLVKRLASQGTPCRCRSVPRILCGGVDMNYQRILVFGAHPDDEIKMAATMAKLAASGVQVFVATMTDGSEGFPDPGWRDRIVEMRAAEMDECDRVLGITKRFRINCLDMGLVHGKQVFKDCIRAVREAKPDAVFTHGPAGINPDHVATHQITVPAVWQAGQPVAADLGEPWEVAQLYYYKEVETCVRGLGAAVVFDVTGYDHYRLLADGTQVSQHTLFGRTREEFEAEAERVKEAHRPAAETFWMSERFRLSDFPPRDA